MTWSKHLLAMALLSLAEASMASESVTFESCTDVAGHTVAAEADYTQATLIRTTYEAGQPTIRYNPTLLPALAPAARQFFYAHECARHALGDVGKAELPLSRVRQADCVGLATLLASGLLARDQVAALQDQLSFSGQEWAMLPGPSRVVELNACRTGGVLRLPAAGNPSARQTDWNACLRACADRLWTCQKACRGASCDSPCMDSHGQCESACGGAPKSQP